MGYYNSTQSGRKLSGKTACRYVMLSLGLAACAISASADISDFSQTVIPVPEQLKAPHTASRGPLDNYWGHQGYPAVPERNGQTHFLTRVEKETNGTLTQVIRIPYGSDLYPSSFQERRLNSVTNEWEVTTARDYKWDSEGHMTYNSEQIFAFDEHGRMVVCEYIYPEYNMRYSYEYDETGRNTKLTTDLIYPDRVVPYDVTDFIWTEADGIETCEMTRRRYIEDTKTWRVSAKEVARSLEKPEGGWTEKTTYVLDSDGQTLVPDDYYKMTIRNIVPGMVNNYATAAHQEHRYGGQLRVTADWTATVTELGNHTVRIESEGTSYRYYYDGGLRDETPIKQCVELQALEYLPGQWTQLSLYSRYYEFDRDKNEMFVSREIKREYDEQGQYLRYEDIAYSSNRIEKELRVYSRDELGREYEMTEYQGDEKEYIPSRRDLTTYVGDSRAFETYQYSYYDSQKKDWAAPSELYEYEWDTSVPGDKCWCFGATPAAHSMIDYKPVSRKATITPYEGISSVEIERYYFNTSEELGGVESVAVDRPAADGPVTVYSLSGANLGVYGSLEEAPVPGGLYIVRRGGAVGKAFKR